MICFGNTKIRKYETFIRDIVNSVIQKNDFSEKLEKSGKTFREKVKERFRFDNDNGWGFLTSCLDTIGDSQFAITDFLNYKIENGKNIITEGERYLRLYGVLSAVYIQQSSILKLCDLFKINNLNIIKDDFKDLNITFLRHCISAHPVNYDNLGKVVSFKIDRNSLTDTGELSVISESNNIIVYNIFNSINQYQKIAENILELICKKVIENSYRTAIEKAQDLKNQLELVKNINQL